MKLLRKTMSIKIKIISVNIENRRLFRFIIRITRNSTKAAWPDTASKAVA